MAACGQIGCNCGAFAPYFFGFFPCLLTPGVEADKMVFKGVQIMHITLILDPKGDRKGFAPTIDEQSDRWHLSVLPTIAVCGCTTHMGAGGPPLFSYVFFPSSEK